MFTHNVMSRTFELHFDMSVQPVNWVNDTRLHIKFEQLKQIFFIH